MTYALLVLQLICVQVILIIGLNFLVGYCGRLTLAHAGYVALGGYAYALVSKVHGWPHLPALAFSAALAALLSAAISLPAWRLRGDFFVIVSLAVQALIASLLSNWYDSAAPLGTLANLTNGPIGISGIPRPLLWPGLEAPFALSVFLTVMLTAAVALLAVHLHGSPWVSMLIAMRDDELAAQSLGKNTRRAIAQAAALSCGLAGLAGALQVAALSYTAPSIASSHSSILYLAALIVGGAGSARGPILGATLLVLLDQALRLLPLPGQIAPNLVLLTFGALLTLMMHTRPQGLLGQFRLQ